MTPHDHLYIYAFDGRWWASVNGQLRPLPETVKTREEAKVASNLLYEPPNG